jgi:hypothetical protein
MINEVAIGHDVLGSSSEVLNVAIIAPRLSFFAFYRRFLLL